MIARVLLATTLLLCLVACDQAPPATVTAEAGQELLQGNTRMRSVDGMVMCYVPGGEFVMGSTDEQLDVAVRLCEESRGQCRHEWFANEQPAHAVTLSDYWIDRTEVTNAQFCAFLNNKGLRPGTVSVWIDVESEHCLIAAEGGQFQPKRGYAAHPVVSASWYGAAAYCEWAGAQLPSEAQWEYAARGPGALLFPWGDEWQGARLNHCDRACEFDDWKDDGSDDGSTRTAPVGSYPAGASWCGALDMSGNVWEWVADWYSEDYYARAPAHNPPGPDSGLYRVQRGGAWISERADTRLALRTRYPASWKDHAVGFRCAVVVGEDDPGTVARPLPQ